MLASCLVCDWKLERKISQNSCAIRDATRFGVNGYGDREKCLRSRKVNWIFLSPRIVKPGAMLYNGEIH